MAVFFDIKGDKVIEGPRELSVAGKTDVIVAGGGPAGITAAVAAARAGAKVILIESHSFLGGVATGCMMAALVASKLAEGISLELINRIVAKNGAPEWDPDPRHFGTLPFDPEAFKEAALEMVCEAGIRLLLYTQVCEPIVADGKAKGVIIESKSGRQAILAGSVIDCTGDADLAHAAGVPCMVGRESDSKMRPFALLFRLGGLDIKKIADYVAKNPEELQPQFREGTLFKVGNEEVITRISGFYNLVDTAKEKGELYPEIHYFRLENLWINRGTAICNTTRIYYVNGADVNDLTKGEIEGCSQIRKLITFVKKYIPGCENAFLIDVASHIGVRETRRIAGEYSLTDRDVYGDAEFEDSIMTVTGDFVKGMRTENLDVHMPDPIEGSKTDLLERYPEKVMFEKHCYQIPYRVLLPKGIDNLLVAGRAISVSHMIDGFTRLMVPVMRFGQVAGTAAALSVKYDISPKNLDYKLLKDELSKQKMFPSE